MVSLHDVRAVLGQHEPRSIPAEGLMKQAAVAAILRDRHGEPELLFIRRAEHPEDPWSGHMAFPGGRVDPEDESAFAAALRETREELALDLTLCARRVGELSHVGAKAHGRPVPLVIVPFVFELHTDPVLAPNDEVAEVLWLPLAFFLDRSNRSRLDYTYAGVKLELDCYRFEGRVIWGLTLRMLDELLELLTR